MASNDPRGLNVAEMNDLVSTCRREANRIRSVMGDVSRAVDATWWRGKDADRFRNEWTTVHRSQVLAVASELESLAARLSREVSAQIRTSNW